MTVQAGINAILYYAPSIFSDLGLDGNTTALLATGLVGIMFWLSTAVSTFASVSCLLTQAHAE
jgi:hypothetical protein